jgi:hypothetical protein
MHYRAGHGATIASGGAVRVCDHHRDVLFKRPIVRCAACSGSCNTKDTGNGKGLITPRMLPLVKGACELDAVCGPCKIRLYKDLKKAAQAVHAAQAVPEGRNEAELADLGRRLCGKFNSDGKTGDDFDKHLLFTLAKEQGGSERGKIIPGPRGGNLVFLKRVDVPIGDTLDARESRRRAAQLHKVAAAIAAPIGASEPAKADATERLFASSIKVDRNGVSGRAVAKRAGHFKEPKKLTPAQTAGIARHNKMSHNQMTGVHTDTGRTGVVSPYAETKEMKAYYKAKTLKSKSWAFRDGDGEVRASVVDEEAIKDVMSKMINKQQDRGRLVWHQGMDKSLIYWKIMMDKGGEHTTLLLACLNILSCDAPENCVALGIMDGGETHNALLTAFGPSLEFVSTVDDFTIGALPANCNSMPSWALPLCVLCGVKKDDEYTVQSKCCPGNSYHQSCAGKYISWCSQNDYAHVCWLCAHTDSW